jgi:hypothetical protein
LEVFAALFEVPGKCPICKHEVVITNISCSHCNTKLEGEFSVSRFSRLNEEQVQFLEAFIKSRGNLKDMEKEVGLSYPTIRNRLEEIIQSLGLGEKKERTDNPAGSNVSEILDSLDSGQITPQEAVKRLKRKD